MDKTHKKNKKKPNKKATKIPRLQLKQTGIKSNSSDIAAHDLTTSSTKVTAIVEVDSDGYESSDPQDNDIVGIRNVARKLAEKLAKTLPAFDILEDFGSAQVVLDDINVFIAQERSNDYQIVLLGEKIQHYYELELSRIKKRYSSYIAFVENLPKFEQLRDLNHVAEVLGYIRNFIVKETENRAQFILDQDMEQLDDDNQQCYKRALLKIEEQYKRFMQFYVLETNQEKQEKYASRQLEKFNYLSPLQRITAIKEELEYVRTDECPLDQYTKKYYLMFLEQAIIRLKGSIGVATTEYRQFRGSIAVLPFSQQFHITLTKCKQSMQKPKF